MHGTDLMRAESLIEEVDGRHLATKNPLFINIWSASDVAFIKRLEKEIR